MFDNSISIAKSLVLLMKPFLEVVIHELATGKILFIEGGLSERQVGDDSNLDEDMTDWEEALAHKVYPKLGFDGRMLKSISIPLKDGGKVVGLMCINFDATSFHQMKHLADLFLEGSQNDQPVSLFKNDWHERIHHVINDYLSQKHWHLAHLTTRQKQEMVRLLYDQGAFQERNAVDYIAKILSMGRATIFNYLRKWRNK